MCAHTLLRADTHTNTRGYTHTATGSRPAHCSHALNARQIIDTHITLLCCIPEYMQDTDSSYPTFHAYTIHTPPCVPACNLGRCETSTTKISRINRNYPPPAGLACLQQENGQKKETCRRRYAQLFAQGHGHGKIKHGTLINVK